jgi:hypothetical protein
LLLLWDDDRAPPAAREVRVGLMGVGVLGHDAGRKLAMMGFDIAGWSRTPKILEGIPLFLHCRADPPARGRRAAHRSGQSGPGM